VADTKGLTAKVLVRPPDGNAASNEARGQQVVIENNKSDKSDMDTSCPVSHTSPIGVFDLVNPRGAQLVSL
jgi:CMP-N-acetylneuraminic acid synthetase